MSVIKDEGRSATLLLPKSSGGQVVDKRPEAPHVKRRNLT